MKKSSTENVKIPRSYKLASLGVLWFFTLLSIAAVRFATKIPTDYAMEQFLPGQHELLKWDRESKKVFQISEVSPHILLLSFDKSKNEYWYQPDKLKQLEKLSLEIGRLKVVRSVTTLATVKSAFEHKNDLSVGTLNELRKLGMDPKTVLNDPKFTPTLLSKDGRFTALFIGPGRISQAQHKELMVKVQKLARKQFPSAQIQMGGPSTIRTQLIDLLAKEIVLFILLSVLAAIAVIKSLFHGWNIVPQIAFILIVNNIIAAGLMGLLGISFNILTSTVPILVTICTLGNVCHTLARMSPFAQLGTEERLAKLKTLVRELIGPHLMAASTTAIGFVTLYPSDVPIISSYGLIVALCVMMASFSSLLIVPSMFLWLRWPLQRNWMAEQKLFAFLIVKHRTAITYSMAVFVVACTYLGMNLSWKAKLFDDLPENHMARKSTDVISRKLGGIAPLDLIIGGDHLREPWKDPKNLKKLDALMEKWRSQSTTGSLVSLADLMRIDAKTNTKSNSMPKTKAAAAELQFLYSMSDENPVRYFLSSNEKWTRVAIRLPDLPADASGKVIDRMTRDVRTAFPNMSVKRAGLAAIVPPMNSELSLELMWGFFGALFWIVLLLSISFRSLRWALVSAIPNFAPPAVLLGVLALLDIPIKPGIAIVFSISIGIAFDNTIYVLGRLRELMKHSKVKRKTTLPMYMVMKTETTPCIISSLALIAGFSIFMFSYFPVNKIFGAFMLISIFAGLLGDLVWMPALLQKFPWLLLGRPKDEILKKEDIQSESSLKETFVRAGSFVILIFLGFMAVRPLYAASEKTTTTVKDLLTQVEHKQAPPNERAILKLVIQEADGTKKERIISILRKHGMESRALVRLLKPADLKGLSVLTVNSKGKEDQWLYLPSAKKSRRIVGSNKKGKFLDSEIAYEDLSISTYSQFDNKVVKESETLVEVESKAKADNESSYGKIYTWIAKPALHVQKVHYYDKSGKLLKQATFSSYQKVGTQYWRARKVSVNNVQTKRKTELFLQKISLQKISPDEVSLSSLEE